MAEKQYIRSLSTKILIAFGTMSVGLTLFYCLQRSSPPMANAANTPPFSWGCFKTWWFSVWQLSLHRKSAIARC